MTCKCGHYKFEHGENGKCSPNPDDSPHSTDWMCPCMGFEAMFAERLK
jgi:hypothetical protein